MQISLHNVAGQIVRVGVRPGRKTAPPLLLFNGIGASIELVEPFLAAFDGPEVVVFDVPGVGGSPAPRLPYRPSTLSLLSAQLLDQLGHARWTCSASRGEARSHSNLPSSRASVAGGSCSRPRRRAT